MTAINNLVEVVNNQVVVSSRMVAERFGKEHKTVLRNIYELTSAQNCANLFQEVNLTDSYGRPQPAFLMTRDGFTLLAMGFTGSDALEWKLKYIKAFNDMEAALSRPKLPQTFAEALRLAATQAEQLEAARPCVEFVETYVDKGHCISIRELGKKIGKRPTKFQAVLRRDKYLMSNNLPYQRHIDAGLFEVRTVSDFGVSQTVATPKAVTYFAEKYKGVDI